MKTPAVILALALASASLSAGAVEQEHEEAIADAVEAAEAWLGLLDKSDFGHSWETAAVLFRNAVTEDQWQQKITAARTPMGKVVFRKLEMSKYETTLPGAPDGEYVVLQFKTHFENKMNAVETVVPMMDPDGRWRVSGYYIK